MPGATDFSRLRSLSLSRSQNALKTSTGDTIGTDSLSTVDWVQELYDEPGMELLLSCGAMSNVKDGTTGIDPDHLFLSMLRQKLITDICFMWNPESRHFYTLVALGSDIAGHPRITHGGLTAALIDETTGGLVFEMKNAGLLGDGRAFTAHLEVDYKRPLPTGINACCTARVLSVEGRKIWVGAEMVDRPGGVPYAVGKALYVTPRESATTTAEPTTAAASATATQDKTY